METRGVPVGDGERSLKMKRETDESNSTKLFQLRSHLRRETTSYPPIPSVAFHRTSLIRMFQQEGEIEYPSTKALSIERHYMTS
ncbi:hypothetical protein V1478_003157 [Vespula squamosa]|uniref:Uncharacterized protein n=1 Tax=Vespula squamosa TaxID=30214 RepID=A0ABD2BRW6_VESSQ